MICEYINKTYKILEYRKISYHVITILLIYCTSAVMKETECGKRARAGNLVIQHTFNKHLLLPGVVLGRDGTKNSQTKKILHTAEVLPVR